MENTLLDLLITRKQIFRKLHSTQYVDTNYELLDVCGDDLPLDLLLDFIEFPESDEYDGKPYRWLMHYTGGVYHLKIKIKEETFHYIGRTSRCFFVRIIEHLQEAWEILTGYDSTKKISNKEKTGAIIISLFHNNKIGFEIKSHDLKDEYYCLDELYKVIDGKYILNINRG